MTEVLPLTLLVIARRGCYYIGQEEGGESSEMHCGRLVEREIVYVNKRWESKRRG